MGTYEHTVGDYHDAVGAMLSNGGQLYVKDPSVDPYLWQRGSHSTVFWKPNSSKKRKLYHACEQFGVDFYQFTPGKLCRWFLDEIIRLPYKSSRFDDRWRRLAKEGYHWHFVSETEGESGYCLEFDIHSAYLSSMTRGESMLVDGKGMTLDDGGAMERLKVWKDDLPRWMRLQLLGIMGSHQKRFLTRKVCADEIKIESKTINNISYVAAFNCTHYAIYRLWLVMREIKRIGGEWVVRVHTDSFTIKADIPEEIESKIFDFLHTRGFQVNIKRQGWMHMFKSSVGVIGDSYIGAKPEIEEYIEGYPEEFLKGECFGRLVDKLTEKIQGYQNKMGELKRIPVQLELML